MVDNDVYDEVLQGLSGSAYPAQIESEKANIIAEMEIEKARIVQKARIREFNIMQQAQCGEKTIWSNQADTICL